jgi:hypothetical protein
MNNYLTPSKAAAIMGVTPSHVRYLCRTGKIRCRTVDTDNNQSGIEYRILKSVAERFRDTESTERRGRPRKGVTK